MLEKYVKLGDKVELRPIQRASLKEEDQEQRIYVSKVNQILAEDKLEIKLCNLEKDNKYNITVFEKGKKANTKVIARTKILDVFAFIQDYYSK